MVVVDLGAFSEEVFDPKRWINAALESWHPQDPLDRFLSDLEENLRAASEKIADALERESGDALRRVPLACRDVVRLRDDALALRSFISSILLKLNKAESTSAECIAALAKIDTVNSEWKQHMRHCRCMNALPDDYKSLVPKLLVDTMSELAASFISCINLATGDVVPETKTLRKGIMDILSKDMPKGTKIQNKHLEALIELHNMTGSFSRNIQHLFLDSNIQVLLSTLKAFYSPYETFKSRYGRMEHAILSSEITGVDICGAVAHGVGAQGIELSEIVQRMEESIP